MLLVIGDAILDRYLFGICPRLSPEAPVPIMQVTGTIDQAGGACNVALNVSALGGNPRLMSIVGQDEPARALVDVLHHNSLSHFHLQQERIETTVKTRHVSGNQHLLRIDSEERAKTEQLDNILKYYGEYVEESDFVIFSDYDKHFQCRAQEIIRTANEAKTRIAVDPKSAYWELYRGADLITPNLKEFKKVQKECGTFHSSEPKDILKRFGIKSMLITEGKDGMTLWNQRRKTPIHVDADQQEVIDVTGAGDTVIAAFALGRVRGYSELESMEFATSAAGAVCRKIGTAVAWANEVKRPELKQQVA